MRKVFKIVAQVVIAGCILLNLINHFKSVARHAPKKYEIGSMAKVSSVIPYAERFRFKHFQKGTVIGKSGNKTQLVLNYSYVYNEPMYLNPAGDTAAISVPEEVASVFIGKHIYALDKSFGYLEVLSAHSGLKVGKKHGLVVAGSDKYMGYRQQLEATAKGVTMTLIPRTVYFFIDENNNAYPAKKAGLLKLYPESAEKIATYLTGNNVDFDKENDLEMLVSYCNSIR